MNSSEEEHKASHNSAYDPKPDCPYCKYEIFRKTHKCFGDGSSNMPTPIILKIQ